VALAIGQGEEHVKHRQRKGEEGLDGVFRSHRSIYNLWSHLTLLRQETSFGRLQAGDRRYWDGAAMGSDFMPSAERITRSTRRLCARPSSVSFVSAGAFSA
jgi:hypothetical protein